MAMKLRSLQNALSAATSTVSPGALLIGLLAVASLLIALFMPVPTRSGLEMWMFAFPHKDAYEPVVEEWDELHPESVDMFVLSMSALERRMLAGFLSATPVADLIEADVNVASRAFTGPLEDVGFIDLTERLREEGIYDKINKPSYSPWTSRGRIFGLPHDVHPVMLCYRSDLVEAAGIDVENIETWDDFARDLQPLMEDLDGDGRPDRYLLNLWNHQLDTIEALMLQGGGHFFDEDENVTLDSEKNARMISKIVTWLTGPARIAIDAEEFQPHGNKLKLDGRVIASIMPDWLGGVWKSSLPQLSGKLKLMPLPAWEPGGRRTSVWGGSMLGVARSGENTEKAWQFAKQLYLSEDAAKRLYETNGIISPIKKLWSQPFYDVTDPYFSGQSPGRMYIELAPDVPPRTSSAFNKAAKEEVRTAITHLKKYADRKKIYDQELLLPEARRLLKKSATAIQRMIDRNVFLREES